MGIIYRYSPKTINTIDPQNDARPHVTVNRIMNVIITHYCDPTELYTGQFVMKSTESGFYVTVIYSKDDRSTS